MSILIKNGTVVNDDAMFKSDVLVENGVIIKVGVDLEPLNESTEIVDATGKLVIPGGIDPHTHMQLPFMGQVSIDDFYSGTRAAVAGGTTMVTIFM